MIIHQPEIKIENRKVVVSAAIEFQTSDINAPDRLWFEFPESYKEFITERADGFSAALFLMGMVLGEDIEIRGVLSPRLLHGMKEYQRFFTCWFPRQFKLIDIKFNNLKCQNDSDVKGIVASAFSGGIDSFYTLWSHLPQNESIPEYQIRYGLFVHGFDIPLEDETTYSTAQNAYTEMMQSQGLQLLSARTNVRDFLDRIIDWGLSHGAALISVPLVLGSLFSRFYVPASFTYTDLFPTGSDPRVIHLLSSETLEIIYDGASATRVEKTSVIANWAATYSQLRVCWVKPDGLKNCCQCEKCIRTMISLDMFGSLSKYSTFPYPLERQNIRNCRYWEEHDRAFASEIIEYANSLGRRDITYDLSYALFQSYYLSKVSQIKQKSSYLYKNLVKKY